MVGVIIQHVFGSLFGDRPQECKSNRVNKKRVKNTHLTDRIIESLPKRFVSLVVDLLLMALIMAFLSLIKALISSFQEIESNIDFVVLISYSLLLNKDIHFGKSFGKKFNDLRVVSIKTGNIASPIQCAIRNLFFMIWPLEGIILIFSPKRRIGDLVAGTMVQEGVELTHETKWPYIQAIISMLTSLIFIYFLITFINNLGLMN